MSTVLLTGGTGFVGGWLRPALHAHPVVLLGRTTPILLVNEQWAHIDMEAPISPARLSGGKVLCHLAYSMQAGRGNVVYNRHLLNAVNACPSVHRVVLVSSISVYGRYTPQVVDEKSPCRPVGEYAETKLACEMVWREGLRRDCELTVLRPTEIVGFGGKGLSTLIRDALERPVVGAAKRCILYHRPLHHVAVSNVVAAILFCLRQPQPAMRETYVVSDDHQPENKGYAAMQDLVREIAGKRPLFGPPMPRQMLWALGKISRRPLGLERTYSSGKIHSAGFRDAVSLRDEVRRLVSGVEGAHMGTSP